jgi:hypothetical protein
VRRLLRVFLPSSDQNFRQYSAFPAVWLVCGQGAIPLWQMQSPAI